ncbi:hypothetical protein MTO96_012829 [Rhipicephalus appendiculatus]
MVRSSGARKVLRNFLLNQSLRWPDEPVLTSVVVVLVLMVLKWQALLWFSIRLLPSTCNHSRRSLLFGPSPRLEIWGSIYIELKKYANGLFRGVADDDVDVLVSDSSFTETVGSVLRHHDQHGMLSHLVWLFLQEHVAVADSHLLLVATYGSHFESFHWDSRAERGHFCAIEDGEDDAKWISCLGKLREPERERERSLASPLSGER